MEPPIADHADTYRDQELKILRQIEPLDPANTVRGQYVGYLDEPGVATDSTTETFVSTKLAISPGDGRASPWRRIRRSRSNDRSEIGHGRSGLDIPVDRDCASNQLGALTADLLDTVDRRRGRTAPLTPKDPFDENRCSEVLPESAYSD
jgi:hypothetical protein